MFYRKFCKKKTIAKFKLNFRKLESLYCLLWRQPLAPYCEAVPPRAIGGTAEWYQVGGSGRPSHLPLPFCTLM